MSFDLLYLSPAPGFTHSLCCWSRRRVFPACSGVSLSVFLYLRPSCCPCPRFPLLLFQFPPPVPFVPVPVMSYCPVLCSPPPRAQCFVSTGRWEGCAVRGWQPYCRSARPWHGPCFRMRPPLPLRSGGLVQARPPVWTWIGHQALVTQFRRVRPLWTPDSF